MELDLQNRRTAVYRLFNLNDELLYVGITFDLEMRFKQHAKDKWWWSEVARHEITWHDTRSEATKVEVSAIFAENPRENVHHMLAGTARLRPRFTSRQCISPIPTAELAKLAAAYKQEAKAFKDAETELARRRTARHEAKTKLAEGITQIDRAAHTLQEIASVTPYTLERVRQIINQANKESG